MALSLDGSANVYAGSGTSVVTGTLTCSNAGNVIIVGCVSNGTDISSISGGGVTFTSRGKTNTGSNYTETWVGYASGTFNSTVTVNFNSSASYATVHAWGINGAPSSSYFDTHASLPSIGTTTPGTVSTTANDTFIFAIFRATDDDTPSVGATWTEIYGSSGGGFLLSQYKIVASAQTGLSVPGVFTFGDSEHIIADAVVMASPLPPVTDGPKLHFIRSNYRLS